MEAAEEAGGGSTMRTLRRLKVTAVGVGETGTAGAAVGAAAGVGARVGRGDRAPRRDRAPLKHLVQ